MKNVFLSIVVLLTNCISTPIFSQTDSEPEALGLPGDNFNLFAVLDIFQKSETLEAFEKSINDKDSNINNLDLNGDNKTDYITVSSSKIDNSHIIVLSVPINSKENQDVAVIDVSKDKSGKIVVQIIGDKNLYGKDYIVESSDVKTVTGTPNPGYKSGEKVIINNNTTKNYNTTNTTVSSANGSAFPIFLFLFSANYVFFHSQYHYGYYPPYWNPWAPVYFRSYWGYHRHYYRNPYYHRTVVIVNPRNYSRYTNRRHSSTIVINNNRRGSYKNTYNGQNYKRPVAPSRPNTRPSNRPNPSPNKPNSRPTTRPTTKPTTPSTRPTVPTRPTAPVSRPTAPTTRPSAPTTRPTAPVSRPTAPTTRPATPTTRPTAPMSRPSTPTTRPTAPVSRPSTPTARPTTSRPATTSNPNRTR